jgi:N-acetylglucosamine-6-phosphate deacetylase
MNPLLHREPGLIGAAMDTGMYMELICDGIHVHPAMVRMMFAAHPEQIVLISDSF